jgi:hypothetical protein
MVKPIMQPEPKRAAAPEGASEEITVCPNCHIQMPSTMRFCRSCGFRLGEGVAEYAETIPLQRPRPSAPAGGATQPPQQAGVRDWSPLANTTATGASQRQPACQASSYLDEWGKKRRRKRAPWVVWVVLGVVITSVTGGSLLSPFGGLRQRSRDSAARNAQRSYVGIMGLETTANGVTFDYITPPGSAADKAGLIGGDIITSFDGQQVTSDDQLMKLLVATPIGKTVSVVFIRDGETRTTQMTTISKAEQDRLAALFDNRPEGKGFLGIEDWERTAIPGTNIYGVRLDDVMKNRPGYMAGLRDGDIVIEFNGTPIRTSRELVARIERALPDSVVKVVVMRGGERLELPIKIGVD